MARKVKKEEVNPAQAIITQLVGEALNKKNAPKESGELVLDPQEKEEKVKEPKKKEPEYCFAFFRCYEKEDHKREHYVNIWQAAERFFNSPFYDLAISSCECYGFSLSGYIYEFMHSRHEKALLPGKGATSYDTKESALFRQTLEKYILILKHQQHEKLTSKKAAEAPGKKIIRVQRQQKDNNSKRPAKRGSNN